MLFYYIMSLALIGQDNIQPMDCSVDISSHRCISPRGTNSITIVNASKVCSTVNDISALPEAVSTKIYNAVDDKVKSSEMAVCFNSQECIN